VARLAHWWKPAGLVVGSIVIVCSLFNVGFAWWQLATGQTKWQRLPSSYAKTDQPLAQYVAQKQQPLLLVEFYTDTCTTCQALTPLLHKVWVGRGDETKCAPLVMVNADDPQQRLMVDVLGITQVPTLLWLSPTTGVQQVLPLEALTPQGQAPTLASVSSTLTKSVEALPADLQKNTCLSSR
jgi:thiol:disulfide interchange protein